MAKVKTKYNLDFEVVFNAFGFAFEFERNYLKLLVLFFIITIESRLEIEK